MTPRVMRALAAIGGLKLRHLLLIGMALFALADFSALALASQSYRVIQKGRAFNLKELTITAGDVVQFSDEDEFLHQIYVESPRFNFDSAEQSPGEVIEVKFPTSGDFEVHCHIHPKMALKVTVQ